MAADWQPLAATPSATVLPVLPLRNHSACLGLEEITADGFDRVAEPWVVGVH